MHSKRELGSQSQNTVIETSRRVSQQNKKTRRKKGKKRKKERKEKLGRIENREHRMAGMHQ